MRIFPIIQALTFAICKIEETSYKATCVRVANLKTCQNSLTCEKKVSIIPGRKLLLLFLDPILEDTCEIQKFVLILNYFPHFTEKTAPHAVCIYNAPRNYLLGKGVASGFRVIG